LEESIYIQRQLFFRFSGSGTRQSALQLASLLSGAGFRFFLVTSIRFLGEVQLEDGGVMQHPADCHHSNPNLNQT
jgi:hypothetical protein